MMKGTRYGKKYGIKKETRQEEARKNLERKTS